jgi:competence protein ComEC
MAFLLPVLAVAQAVGIWLADRGWLGSGGAGGIAAAALLGGLLVRRARARAVAALALALAAGALTLALQLEQAARGRPAGEPEGVVEARVHAVRAGPAGLEVDLEQVRALEPGAAPVPERIRVRVPPEADAAVFEPGARLVSRLSWSAPRGLRNPGRPRDPRGLERRGIAAAGRLVDPALVARRSAPPTARAWLFRQRGRLAARLARAGDGSALLRALALGDTGGLGAAHFEHFSRLGISHLLSVSGLHLVLVAVPVYGLARRVLSRSAALAARCDVRDAARAGALLAAAGYALLCGFDVPVRRSLVLLAALVVAAARARSHPPFHPLAAAALVVLAWQPEALFAAGAQLSFAGCLALVWLAAREPGGPDPRWPRLASAVSASAVASAATAPLVAWHFGGAAPAAVAANLVAIPWTGVVLMPASFAAAVSAAAAPPELADRVIGVAAWLAARSLDAGAWLALRAPAGPEVRLHPAALALATLLAIITLRLRGAAARAGVATLAAVLLWCAPPAAQLPPPPRVVVLDVGRGDSVLVQGRSGAALIDGAAALAGRFDLGASAVVPALRALGVRRLDLVVASHADLDHRGGLPAVFRSLPVSELWLPAGAGADPGFTELRAAARESGVALREVGLGDAPRSAGDLRVTPLWPPRAGGAGPRNERSLVVSAEAAGSRVLVLGDLGAAEAALVVAHPDVSADVLLLPHHGSGGSSSEQLLAAVAPEVAIVSAPCPPQRGLPHPGAIARARRAGASVWWTGRDGALLVGLGKRLAVLPYADARDCAGPAATPSVPWNASTSGRHTKRTGGRRMSAAAIDADTG